MDRPQFDPGATQPMPTVRAEVVGDVPPPPAPAPAPGPARFEHRFGNPGVYLLRRLFAFAIDVFGVTFLLATFGTQATTLGAIDLSARSAASFVTLTFASLGIALALMLVSEGFFGFTLGKLIFGLHVGRANGGWAGPGRAFIRMLLRPIDLLLIGPLLALVTPRHQRLGDFCAGTVVDRSRLGIFAPILGLIFAGLAAYAQLTFGGGLTSALAVGAQGAVYLPQFYRGIVDPLYVAPPLAPRALASPTPSAAASGQPGLAPGSNASEEPAPSPAASDSPASDETPVPDETPAPSETHAPASGSIPG
ncbi:MAG TPA: RDD family protein [Candidatus Baltobacteraceae bacterium]|nr:RDD family protein [Candidatus Baltobacteraceae bacterium]